MTYRNPTPATKASRLVDQLRSLAPVEEPDELLLRRIERETRGLMTADPVGAHTVLGVLASLRGNAADVRYHNDIALQQSGRTADTLNNYSVCLLQIGDAADAFESAREAFQGAPDNSVVLNQLILTAIESAHFREARDLCDRWNALYPDRPVPYESPARSLAGAVDRGVFREESARAVLQIAQEIRRAANVRHVETAVVEDCTEPDSFLYKVHVAASPAVAVDLNEKVADRIVARPDLMADPGLEFVPMFIGTRVDAGHS